MSALEKPLLPQAGDQNQKNLDTLARSASTLGRDIVEVAGFLDRVDSQSSQQKSLIEQAEIGSQKVTAANDGVINAVSSVAGMASEALEAVRDSVSRVSMAGQRTTHVAEWVQALDERMGRIEAALKAVLSSNTEVSAIASQVNILAVNAKIEAARAGVAGRGFSVVAEAVNDLSLQTTAAADAIQKNVQGLSGSISELRSEASGISEEARMVLDEASDTDTALNGISQRVQGTAEAASEIERRAQEVEAASSSFGPVFQRIASGFKETVEGVHVARQRVAAMVDTSERIVQGSVELGAATADQMFIDHVKELAAQVSYQFEKGIDEGTLQMGQLFSTEYRPIAGSDPEQFMTPFVPFTDKVLPPIQEPVLALDAKVVFCACVNRDGFLPTHNNKFSRPPSDDPVWNAANCRNRRMFNDRVGLKAGQSTKPFLLQVYERDMGGGKFAMMKDLSAPIMVKGRHWGGIRLAFRF